MGSVHAEAYNVLNSHKKKIKILPKKTGIPFLFQFYDFFKFARKEKKAIKKNQEEINLFSDRKYLDESLVGKGKSPNILSMEGRYNWLYSKKKYLGWNDLEISTNYLRIKYKGSGISDEDAAGINSNNPIPSSLFFFYFEIKIISTGGKGYIGVGLSDKNANLNRLPGWEKDTLGYHGDDGFIFRSSGLGVPYGPTFRRNDTIGLCLNLVGKTIFFTKNGIGLDLAFFCLKSNFFEEIFPFLGLRTKGETVETNFGAKIFEFDINSYLKNFQKLFDDKIFFSNKIFITINNSYQSLFMKGLNSPLIRGKKIELAEKNGKIWSKELGEKNYYQLLLFFFIEIFKRKYIERKLQKKFSKHKIKIKKTDLSCSQKKKNFRKKYISFLKYSNLFFSTKTNFITRLYPVQFSYVKMININQFLTKYQLFSFFAKILNQVKSKMEAIKFFNLIKRPRPFLGIIRNLLEKSSPVYYKIILYTEKKKEKKKNSISKFSISSRVSGNFEKFFLIEYKELN